MNNLKEYIIEKLRINKNINVLNIGNKKDTKVRIKKSYSKEDYRNQSEEDFIDPNNHVEISFPKKLYANGFSLETLLNYTSFKENINSQTIKNLLFSVADKKINGKYLPKYSSPCAWNFNVLNDSKDLFKNVWDIFYVDIDIKEKNPVIFFQTELLRMRYITNLEEHGIERNYNSDGVKELVDFVDKNFKYQNKKDNVIMKIAFWNDRFSIFKFEIEDSDKFILSFCIYFARMNDTSDPNNKFYYKN